MKHLALLAGAALLVLANAAPANSADTGKPAYKAPAYIAPFTWSGLYAGINGSYGWGNTKLTDPTLGRSSNVARGYLEGGTVGYNVQTGSWVWGVEGDFDLSIVKANETTYCGVTPGCEFQNRWLATGRGRVGYAFDRLLVYGTGGAAYGEFKVSKASSGSEIESKPGWTVGAGLEYAITRTWSIKTEYLYVDLGSFGCSLAICGGPDSRIKMPLNIARLGLNYRF